MKKCSLICVILLLRCLDLEAQYLGNIKIEHLLKTDTTSIGQPINYPESINNEVTISKITIPPGQTTGWHKHDFPVFACILSGTLQVTFEGNLTRVFSRGDSFAEAIGKFHQGQNIGNDSLVIMAIYLGQKNQPLSNPLKK